MKTKVGTLVLILVIQLGLSVQAKSQEAPFSINDLAILFPVDVNTTLPKQKVTLENANWKILSKTNFNAVLAAAGKSGVYLNEKFQNPANWYLVGIRYSPCTIFAGLPKPCTEQIRFILQPHNILRGIGFDDYAIHVVFNFADILQPTKTPVLESFRKVKNQFGGQTANKTLKPHPVLDSQSGAAYLSSIEKEIISKYINPRSASVVTFMGLAKDRDTQVDDPHDWRFLAGKVNAQGIWTLGALPTGHAETFEQFKLSDEGEIITNLKPIKGQENIISAPATMSSALNILEMKKTNDHNVSCASCHVADQSVFPVMMDQVDRKKFTESMMWMFKGKSRLTEAVINNDIHVGRKGSEFPIPRVFGYLDTSAVISQRMVLDMATSVEQANKLLGLKEVPQCAKDSQRLAFIDCLYYSDYQANVSKCLQKACY